MARSSENVVQSLPGFDNLPDEILLYMFSNFFNHSDLVIVRNVCKRFESVSKDRELVRKVSFSGCYGITNSMVVTYLKPVAQHIEELNLNHCYWLSARCCNTIVRCSHLVSLHLLHLRISMLRLVSMLARLKQLQQLSVTLCNVLGFQSELDRNPQAQDTLRGVRVLTVQVKNVPVHANQMTMQWLEYCTSLEEFHVQGSFWPKDIPFYVDSPQIRRLENLRNIHTMSVTDAMDHFARMFFNGVLLEVCKLPDLRFRTLLLPQAVSQHLARNDNFIRCIQRIEDLQHLDISQTNYTIPNEVYQLERARNLCYLNVADNLLMDCHSLQVLADSCPHLASINLRNCHRLYLRTDEHGVNQVDFNGLLCLVLHCTNLRHINVSGVHIHTKDLTNTGFSSLCHLLTLNNEWQSLSLSPCCLRPRHREGQIEQARKRASPLIRRSRHGFPVPNLNVGEREELSSDLGQLVAACPNLQYFELIGAGFRSSFDKRYKPENMRHFMACSHALRVMEADILCIRRWRNLKYLQLLRVPCIISGRSLAGIMAQCQNLRHLHLGHLGQVPLGSYQPNLQRGLPFALCITDLRIEQCHFNLMETFWQALSQMQSLQRLCILSKNATFNSSHIQHFVQQVPSLVVLHLFVSSTMALKECNWLQRRLVRMHQEQRPALSVCILPMKAHIRVWHQIPDIHLDTLTIPSSSVCLTPSP